MRQSPNTAFPAELSSDTFNPVGRWRTLLSTKQIEQLESLIGSLLQELGYPLSTAPSSLNPRCRALKAVYPAFYSLKEWLKLNTVLGRFVNIDRLVLQSETP